MRSSIIAELELLSMPSAQLAYEASLTDAGHAPSELLSVFCDDLFHPRDLARDAVFTDDEIKGLAHLYGLMVGVGLVQGAGLKVVAVAAGVHPPSG